MRIRTMVSSLLLMTAGALPALGGCAESGGERATKSTKPHLLALSTYSASLGTSIDGYLENGPPASARVDLVFDGTFTRAGGGEERVALTQPAERSDIGAIRWTSFGPFANPFSPKTPDIGVFRGKVGVKVTLADGTTTMDENPLQIDFEVLPSIVVTELQPTTATCGAPALRLIGDMAYKMKAVAIGFNPTHFEYAFKTPGIVLDKDGQPTLDADVNGETKYRMTSVAHDVSTTTDSIDGAEALLLPPVPPDSVKYGVVFAITARDDAGRTVHSTFGMTAHKPLEIYNDKRFALAQIYPAEPVSSCMPGGQQGRHVSYSESKVATRQRTSTLSFSRSWLKSDQNSWQTSDGVNITTQQTATDSFSRTHGTANTLSFDKYESTTTGVSFNWQDTTTIGGSLGAHGSVTVPLGELMPELCPLCMGTGGLNGGVNGSKSSSSGGGYERSDTSGWRQGTQNTESIDDTTSHSTSTTDSTSIEKTDTKGGSTSESESADTRQDESWTVTSASTIDRSFSGDIIAGTYGVFYRQLARYTHKAFVLEYNKCGESEVVGDITLDDYVWAPDLALGKQCPPFPQSNMPKPQCFLGSCTDQ